MYIPFTENKCICDLSVGHIDGELFRDIGVSWVIRKHKLDVTTIPEDERVEDAGLLEDLIPAVSNNKTQELHPWV